MRNRLIRLIKNRGCYITGIFLPKDTTVYASHVIMDVWHIKFCDNSLSVIEKEDFEFVD